MAMSGSSDATSVTKSNVPAARASSRMRAVTSRKGPSRDVHEFVREFFEGSR